ncbi:atlastin-1-like [Corticium candelabrum]|uniref:atlastin-1-like n=1 Tax=Corticium candelabrum TaxID=121492 RepID=UPI002E25AAF5|nr:atlastin-1-like [Corticium candelabrum]
MRIQLQDMSGTGTEDVSTTHTGSDGEPVQVVVATETHAFELDVEALERLLLSEEVRDRNVCVVTVAGAFRKGKSFLLDFMLRYLEAKESRSDWLGDSKETLEGFHWRGGSERDTTGILLWSKPFIVKHPVTDEEVVVLLMDTQGAFDTNSTMKDCATVFALSTMISSLLVYNISSMIREDDLQHLQLFTEYGRMALLESAATPFQGLMFLVRDWSYEYEYSYGSKGGNEYLKKVLLIDDKQHDQLKLVRKHIHECFEDVQCFLMPHPGLSVATNPKFKGKLSEIEDNFKSQLKELVPMLLAPKSLVVKSINGVKVTGRALVECFKSYMKVFEGDELPEPKTVLEATAEANNLAAMASSLDCYNKVMEEICGGDRPFVSPTELEGSHEANKRVALDHFDSIRKMGGAHLSREYRERLDTQIEDSYSSLCKQNNAKNIFTAVRTPTVFLSLILFFWFLKYVVSFVVTIVLFERLVGFLIFMSFAALAVWAYGRWSGYWRDAAQVIDYVSEFLWDQVFAELYVRAVSGVARSQVGIKQKKQ